MKYFLFIFTLIVSQVVSARDFSFNQGFDGWGNWGTGQGVHDSEIGNRTKGSLRITTDVEEIQTVHFETKDLTPGIYKITAFVRSAGINPSSDKTSFWHFYDAGLGTQNVFTELDGRYDWRKISYTLKVEKDALTIWFRLKSPGQVWIDDVSISSASSLEPLSIATANDFNNRAEKNKAIKTVSNKVLLDFDKTKNDHSFDVTKVDKQNSGRFSSHKYYNFDVSDYLNADWSKFDRIELDVFNGNKENVEFFLTLADDQTRDYWSQLNHKTHLASGWNHLSFSLSQFLGERGSHRVSRPLKLSKIKKWFIVADQGEKYKKNSNFYIDNIKLTSAPYPVVPQNIMAYDFTSQRDQSENGFLKVTSNTLFKKDLGHGFTETQFWRAEDAQWIASPLRYSIGVRRGHFKVSLPNGNYSMSLNFERLGYWDVSFWQNRSIQINGKTVFKELRTSANDFLQDWLRFEKIIPEFQQHPFDLYIKSLLKAQEFSFEVKNGELDIEFIGDATGISLNSLVIWEQKDSLVAKKFLTQVEDRMRLEFDWMARPLDQKSKSLPGHLVSIIEPTLTLKPQEIYPEISKELKFKGGIDEMTYQTIQLRGQGEASWAIDDLVNENGKKFPSNNVVFSEIIPQFVSSDLNHETYFLAGKYLKETIQSRIQLDGKSTRYLMLQVTIPKNVEPGIYKSKLVISNSLKQTSFDVVLQVLNYQLPKIEFPVGFFGPDPISSTYFEGAGIEKIRLDYKIKAIELLGKSGFTTFTGFPEVKLNKSRDDWSLDTTSLDTVLKVAEKFGMVKTYFSYGGSFPSSLFDGSVRPESMPEDAFFNKVSPLLSKYLDKEGVPKLVYTFSDEASGYSDKVKEDVEKGKKIKAFFPFMYKGGFGSKNDSSTSELNTLFNFGFYSNVTKIQMRGMNRSQKWGTYNASPGNLDDPRFSFGPGLYYAYKSGLNHYLEWHSTGIQNYPYYDLDGRESDVVMFYPSINGELYSTLRFTLATEGLHVLKKLILLENLLNKTKTPEHKDARDWLAKIKKGEFSSSANILKPEAGFDYKAFKQKLDAFLADPKLTK